MTHMDTLVTTPAWILIVVAVVAACTLVKNNVEKMDGIIILTSCFLTATPTGGGVTVGFTDNITHSILMTMMYLIPFLLDLVWMLACSILLLDKMYTRMPLLVLLFTIPVGVMFLASATAAWYVGHLPVITIMYLFHGVMVIIAGVVSSVFIHRVGAHLHSGRIRVDSPFMGQFFSFTDNRFSIFTRGKGDAK